MSIRRRGTHSHQVRLSGEKARTFPTRLAAEKYELNRKLARTLGDLHVEEPITVNEMLDGYLHRWQVTTKPAVSSVKRAIESYAFWKRELGGRGRHVRPTCPRCGEPAAIVLGPTQAFCGNDECRVLTWNPSNPESWEREHVVNLSERTPDGGT